MRTLLALLYQVYDVYHKRFVHDCAERTLVNASAAGDTLVVVDFCGFVFTHRNCLDLARALAGTYTAHDCRIGANFRTRSAFFAFCFVNVRNMV